MGNKGRKDHRRETIAGVDRALASNGPRQVGRPGAERSREDGGGTESGPSPKAALGLGIIILCLLSGVLGSCVSNAAEPSTVTVTEEIRVPVTDLKTVTVAPRANEVLSQACARIIDAATNQQAGYQQLGRVMGELSAIIDDTGKVVYTEDPNEVIRLSGRARDLRHQQIEAWNKIGAAAVIIDANLPNCQR